MIWVDPKMSGDGTLTCRRGRQKTYSYATMQTTRFVDSLLQLVGLDLTVPDFSTLCRRQRTLTVNIPSGAYDTRKCHDAISVRGAQAVIQPRKNTKRARLPAPERAQEKM